MNFGVFLHLENNPIHKIDCNIALMKNRISIWISWKNLVKFGEYCDGLPFPQRIVKNNQFEGIFPAAYEKYELHCGEESFRNIKELYIIRGEYENIAKILDCFGPSLEKVLL